MNEKPLPSFRVIAQALRVTTERLTREVGSPRDTAPAWSDFEWSVARAVSALHGISALLATRLRWRGPIEWQQFLRDQQQQSVASYERVGPLLARLNRMARQRGLAYLPLKGAAIREHALHHPGERPMGDIDVMVKPEDSALAKAVIEALGYRESHRCDRHITFQPLESAQPHAYAEHADNPLRIEVHERVNEPLPLGLVDITESLWPTEIVAGANPYASFAALMRHLMLHAAGNMRANTVRFVHIYEIALMALRMGPTDWAELRGHTPQDAWWMFPALAMAESYLPESVPASVMEEFAALAPRRLRRRYRQRELHEVSWSNLRILAFPGIEWARSWREALSFARSRALPQRKALNELMDSVANSTNLGATRWYGVSHAERILRWVFSRPPRVQTLHSVRAALAAATQSSDADPDSVLQRSRLTSP